jgi:hypothetical protein
MKKGDETPGNGIELSPIPTPEHEFADLWYFIRQLLLDTAKNLALLGALSAIFFAARLLEKLGMDATELHHIHQLHFWTI